MQYFQTLSLAAVALFMTSCSGKDNEADATGNFEADEVIVSAQQTGILVSFPVKEGDSLRMGAIAGQIDVTGVILQKEQVQATISALKDRTTDPLPQLLLVRKQLAVQQAQLAQQLHEKQRTENLVKADAATPKQLDDINAQIEQLQRQISVTQQQLAVSETNVANQNRGVMSEKAPLEKSVAQFEEQISKGRIINPITGTVLTTYALQGELATVGRALYKIANLDTLLLKAYVTGTQLPQIRTGQQVEVRIDADNGEYKTYPGVISWISDKSEFTPKTIQTKDERANLVYAIKIRVKNDGYLKIGMYGAAKFH